MDKTFEQITVMKQRTGKLSLIAPWNAPNYFPCNAFHPIYQSLIVKNDNIDFYKPKLSLFLTAAGETFDTKSTDFFKFFSSRQVQHIDHPKNIIQFHHTVPLVSNEDKFFFHCESFLPIFMPYAFQGSGFKTNVDKIRKSYQDIFASPNCLGIFSHIKETLQEIDNFFDCPAIRHKMHFSPFIPPKQFTTLGNENAPVKSFNGKMRYLFTSSAARNGSDQQFILRGGIVALKLAINLSSRQDGSTFVFQSEKPKPDTLDRYGIEPASIQQLEDSGIIEWRTGYLATSEIYKLFITSHFLLLLSANLHSATITQAMCCGTIPMLIDNPQTKSLLDISDNTTLVDGMSALFNMPMEEGYNFDNHQKFVFPDVQDKIFVAAVEKISALLANRPALQQKSEQNIADFNTHFSPTKNASILSDKLLSAANRNGLRSAWKEELNSSYMPIDQSDFETPIRPELIFSMNGHNLFKSPFGYYVQKPGHPIYDPLCWDLSFKKTVPGFYFFNNYDKAVQKLFKNAQFQELSLSRKTINTLKKLLKKNKTAFKLARTLYHHGIFAFLAELLRPYSKLYRICRSVFRYTKKILRR